MSDPTDSASQFQRRGLMLILSSPSGAGKTTLTRMLLQARDIDLTLSISVTTRARRSSEVDGIHYNFIQRQQFERMRDAGDLHVHAPDVVDDADRSLSELPRTQYLSRGIPAARDLPPLRGAV